MSTQQPITHKIFDYVKSCAVPPTREDIVRAVPTPKRETVVAQVRDSVKRGYLKLNYDEMGIPRYSAVKKPVLCHTFMSTDKAKEAAKIKSKQVVEAKKEEAADAVKEVVNKKRYEQDIEMAYQRGYTDGRNDGLYHSNREAYTEGKNATIKALMKKFVAIIEDYERGV